MDPRYRLVLPYSAPTEESQHERNWSALRDAFNNLPVAFGITKLQGDTASATYKSTGSGWVTYLPFDPSLVVSNAAPVSLVNVGSTTDAYVETKLPGWYEFQWCVFVNELTGDGCSTRIEVSKWDQTPVDFAAGTRSYNISRYEYGTQGEGDSVVGWAGVGSIVTYLNAYDRVRFQSFNGAGSVERYFRNMMVRQVEG